MSQVPEDWAKHGGVIIPMHQSEAMWMNFSVRASGDPFPLYAMCSLSPSLFLSLSPPPSSYLSPSLLLTVPRITYCGTHLPVLRACVRVYMFCCVSVCCYS